MNEDLRQGVERLIAMPFSDAAALGSALDAPLGAAQELDGFLVHTSATGRIGDVPVRDIELRRSADGVGDVVLMMALTSSAITFDPAAWPGAVPRPPNPDAAASSASWSFQQGGATVVLGLDAGQTHLARILIRKR